MALTRITRGVIKPNENYDTHNINSTGIVTAIGLNVSGNASIGGVLTYEDVTNVDSVGIITARVGVDCDGDLDVDGHTNLDNVSVAGVSTFSGNVSFASSISTPTNVNINVGSNDEIQLRYNGNIGTLDMFDYNAFCMAIRSAYTLILRANFGTNTAALGDGYGLDIDNVRVQAATPDYDLGSPLTPFGTFFSKQANFSGITTAQNGLHVLNGYVGIGTAFPGEALDINSKTNSRAIRVYSEGLSSTSKLVLRTGDNGTSKIHFGDTSDIDVGEIRYRHSDDSMEFYTNTNERLRITSAGKVGINQTTWTNKDHMFEVKQETNDKEIARFSNTGGGAGNVQGKGFIGLSIFNTTTYPHVSIGVEEAGNGNFQGHLTFATRDASNDSAPTERLRITSGGVVSVGNQPKSWHSAYKVLQVGAASLVGQVEGDGTTSNWSNNAYFDTTNNRWEYSGAASDEASQITLSDGLILFKTAAAGTADNALTWVETLRIGSSGQIGIAGANYGTSGQVLTSGGPSASPTWGAAPSGVPQGCIILWSGAANAIPSGYVLCDNSTEAVNAGAPDLRNKFVVGASSSGNTTYPGLSVDAEGGSADAVVVEHKHTTNIDGGHVIPGNGGSSFPYGGAGTYSSTVFSMSNEGVSGTNKNLPPYYALCYIMKT